MVSALTHVQGIVGTLLAVSLIASHPDHAFVAPVWINAFTVQLDFWNSQSDYANDEVF